MRSVRIFRCWGKKGPLKMERKEETKLRATKIQGKYDPKNWRHALVHEHAGVIEEEIIRRYHSGSSFSEVLFCQVRNTLDTEIVDSLIEAGWRDPSPREVLAALHLVHLLHKDAPTEHVPHATISRRPVKNLQGNKGFLLAFPCREKKANLQFLPLTEGLPTHPTIMVVR